MSLKLVGGERCKGTMLLYICSVILLRLDCFLVNGFENTILYITHGILTHNLFRKGS